MMINLPFLNKSKAGISISTDYISYAELEKSGGEYRVKDIKSFDSKGCIRPSLTDANITDTVLFKKAIKTLIGDKRRYVCLSIPDTSVKTALFELESIPSKKAELEKLIKWKMEKTLPFTIDDAQISYQALNKKNIFISVIRKGVLYQYEELLREAGVEPVLIDTASSHIFNLFHNIIIKGGGNFIFLNIADAVFTLMIFKKGCPDFIRIKALRGGSGEIKRIKDELLASLKFYSHNKEISDLTSIYYIADVNIGARELIEDSAMQVKRLGIEQIKWLKGNEGFNLLPAIGAAMERE